MNLLLIALDTQMNLGFSFLSYRNTMLNLKSSLDMEHRRYPLKFLFGVSLEYGILDSIVAQNNLSAYLNTDYYITPVWEVFFLSQYMRDAIISLDARLLAGVGIKRKLLRGISLSYALLYNFERKQGQSGNFARHSLRLKLGKDNFALVVFYQPLVDEHEDYWLWGRITYSSSITENISFKFELYDRYESKSYPYNRVSTSFGFEVRF